jgi:hypothetical protein
MKNNISTIKIQMVTDHLSYKKGQIVELEEKQAVKFLTNGKALKIHRKKEDIAAEKNEERIEQSTEENTQEKGNKKSKKSD